MSTFWMDRALSLARRGRDQCSPNPPVGAVLTKEGRLIGEGWHRGPGQPHAEIEALRDATRRGKDPRGATLWVTLEPCCHDGPGKRTPPCTPQLIDAGIGRVFAAVPDPNPQVSGKGKARLEQAGIEFAWGPCETEAQDLIAPFRTWIVNGRPFVTLKWAQSLEGRLCPPGGGNRWITGAEARKEAHRLRSENDSVAVGAGTLRVDNPELTVRLVPESTRGQPRRLVFCGGAPLPKAAKVFSDGHRDLTWLVVRPGTTALKQAEGLCPGHVLTWDGVDWNQLGRLLGSAGFYRILVEGGPTLLRSFLAAGFWDQVAVFVAPKVLGGDLAPHDGLRGGDALTWTSPRWKQIDHDALFVASNPGVVCSQD